MRRNPERTAWAVLLGSFFIFCALVVAIPWTLTWWVRSATETQYVTLESSGTPGTVLVTRPGHDKSEAGITEVPVGSIIQITDADSLATLTFVDRRSQAVAATVRLYGRTWITLNRAESPRFGSSQAPELIQVQVAFGRLRARLLAADKHRALQMSLGSPAGTLTTLSQPNSEVALEVGAQTNLTVREGQATITQAGADAKVLMQNQRAVANAQGLQGPLPSERQLINNATFEQPLGDLSVGNNWVVEPARQDDPADNMPGTVTVEAAADQGQSVHFSRRGITQLHHAQLGLSQNIDQDVHDFKTLVLQLDVLVSYQDLYNCGELGSECPVMVRLVYQDTSGKQQTWLRGFYYNSSDQPGTGQTKCPSCAAIASDHQRVSQGVWQSIQTENLVDLFRTLNAPPAIIKSITVEAGGHSFDSAIANVKLLGAE